MHVEIRETILNHDLGIPQDFFDENPLDDGPIAAGPLAPYESGGGGGGASGGGSSPSTSKLEYYKRIVRNLQIIFGHLTGSQLQFYVPRRFWQSFRYGFREILGKIFFWVGVKNNEASPKLLIRF